MSIAVTRTSRLSGKEPIVLAGGAGILAATQMLPVFWDHGETPIPPCVFHTLTGQPCPFCGATRSFVWTAHGQWADAFLVFPIGPLMFAAMLAAMVYAGWAIVSGRRLRLVVSPRLARAYYIGLLVILGVNWLSKLLFLGYGPSPIA
ncbi:MAG: hypothetical protein QOE92_1549 [Chloroflexota bacterium]|nr:hypothetical protein [Chloroflexota bacterium]